MNFECLPEEFYSRLKCNRSTFLLCYTSKYIQAAFAHYGIYERKYNMYDGGKYGHTYCLNRLVNKDVTTMTIDEKEEMMETMCTQGNYNVVELLLEHVIPTYSNIYEAMTNGHMDIMRKLLDDGRVPLIHDSITFDDDLLQSACWNGMTEAVYLLLQNEHIDPTADNHASLRWACLHGHERIVELLLSDGRADPSCLNNYPSQVAKPNVLHLLLADPRVNEGFHRFIYYQKN